MQTLTVSEFKKLISSDNWERKIVCENFDGDSNYTWGFSQKTSILNNIKITYTEAFKYENYLFDSLTTNINGIDDVWLLDGVIVVDDDGDKLNGQDLSEYFSDDFSAIDYKVTFFELIFTKFQISLIPLIDKETGFFDVFDYTCKDYVAEWNRDLIGYVFTFTDGKNAQAQVYTELDKLHGNYDEKYLERHTEYDDDLSDEQECLINSFIEQLNFVKKTINDNNIYSTD